MNEKEVRSPLIWMKGENDKNDEMKGDNYERMITHVEKVEIVENKTSYSKDVIETENSVSKKKPQFVYWWKNLWLKTILMVLVGITFLNLNALISCQSLKTIFLLVFICGKEKKEDLNLKLGVLLKEIKDLSKKSFVKVNVKENEPTSPLVIAFQKIKMFKEKEEEEKEGESCDDKKIFSYYHFIFDVVADLHSCWSIYNFEEFKFNFYYLYYLCKNTFERSKINMNWPIWLWDDDLTCIFRLEID